MQVVKEIAPGQRISVLVQPLTVPTAHWSRSRSPSRSPSPSPSQRLSDGLSRLLIESDTCSTFSMRRPQCSLCPVLDLCLMMLT